VRVAGHRIADGLSARFHDAGHGHERRSAVNVDEVDLGKHRIVPHRRRAAMRSKLRTQPTAEMRTAN